MFPLPNKSFPPNAVALREALEETLRRVLQPAGQMVTVEEKQYPKLTTLRISLDHADAGDRPPPRPAPPVGQVEPALQVENFAISGRPIRVQRARVNFSCTARDVQIGQGRDKEDNLLLLLQDATEGEVDVALAVADLEALVMAGAQAEADKHGVTVENVRIELRSRSDRALDAVVHVRAKKLFLSATLRISGCLAIDEHLNARLTGLECAGDGPLGTVACGFIAPHLARFDGRDFSLMTLPLGEVKLRDIRIDAGRELRVTAHFGRTA